MIVTTVAHNLSGTRRLSASLLILIWVCLKTGAPLDHQDYWFPVALFHSALKRGALKKRHPHEETGMCLFLGDSWLSFIKRFHGEYNLRGFLGISCTLNSSGDMGLSQFRGTTENFRLPFGVLNGLPSKKNRPIVEGC